MAGVAPSTPPVAAATQAPPQPASAAQENLFWQSIMNSTNAAEFEAYLEQFPSGVFRALAQARLAALRSVAADPPAEAGTRVAGAGAPAPGSRAARVRVSGAAAPAFGGAAGGDVRRRRGEVFRDCVECPEMVVLPGGNLAMGRYEVTVAEYRAFASATGGRWERLPFWRFVARSRLSADGTASCDVRELGRRAGVCVVAEPDDGQDLSVADRGGMGARCGGVSARMRDRTDGESGNVSGRFLRFERGRRVGHGGESD